MTEPDTRPYTVDFTLTREALDVITACNNRVIELGQFYGDKSPQYRDAAVSLLRQMVSLFGQPWQAQTRVMKDGPLSLIVNSGITFGIIWHEVQRRCANDGCRAVINDDGTAWTYMPDFPMCDNHELSFPLDAPHPGTWSFHS